MQSTIILLMQKKIYCDARIFYYTGSSFEKSNFLIINKNKLLNSPRQN